MNEADYYELVTGLKPQILHILRDGHFGDSTKGKRAKANINNIFRRFELQTDDLIPGLVAKRFSDGGDDFARALRMVGLDGKFGKNYYADDIDLQSRVHVEAITNIDEDMRQSLKAAIRTAKAKTDMSINKVLDEFSDTLKGGIIRGSTRKEMTKAILENFEKDGFTSFITKDGKKLPLDFYAQTVTRTGLKKANVEGALKRYEDAGGDLFTVSGHTPTCASCWNYRGITFSASGLDTRFPSGKNNKPPYHPNCMCSVQPVVEKYMTDEELKDALEAGKKFNNAVDSRPDNIKEAYRKDQALKRKLNNQKKEYNEMKILLGDDAPKTLGGYRRSQRAGGPKYKGLEQRYKTAKWEASNKSQHIKNQIESLGGYKSKVIEELSDSGKEALQMHEFNLKSLSNEQGTLFNSDGEMLWKQKGNHNSVNIRDAIERDLLRGNVFTHNHPGSSSFSDADINIMLVHDLKEIRAIGRNGYLYRARPPKNPQTRLNAQRKLRETVTRAETAVRKKLQDEINAGTLLPKDANISHWDLIWEYASKELKFDYERIIPNE